MNDRFMKIRYLTSAEKDKSRRLYEDAFPEDSEEFVEYYYTEKCRDNQILVMEDEDTVVSMIHLNPFTVSMYGQETSVCYIVAVATDWRYRMKGHMRNLMERAFHDLYEAEQPFAFLTPANPDYYYSCGFEYWENQIQLLQDQDTIWNGRQRVDAAVEADCESLAAFSNETLASQFDLFVKKDRAYYARLLKEQECDGGHILLVREQPEVSVAEAGVPETEISGIFCLNKGLGMYVREPIFSHSCSEQVQGMMMGRIIHLESFCRLLRSKEPIDRIVRVRDTMLPENEGCYHIRIDEDGGYAERIYGNKIICMDGTDRLDSQVQSVDIAELGQLFFDQMRIYINEVV